MQRSGNAGLRWIAVSLPTNTDVVSGTAVSIAAAAPGICSTTTTDTGCRLEATELTCAAPGDDSLGAAETTAVDDNVASAGTIASTSAGNDARTDGTTASDTNS